MSEKLELTDVEQTEPTEVVESAEPTAEVTNETTDNLSSESSKPVETLSQAKEVLKAQKEAKEKAANDPKAKAKEVKDEKAQEFDYRKAYDELNKNHGKTTRELGELRKRDKEYKEVLDAFNAAKKRQEDELLLNQYQTDPQAAIRELAKREAALQTETLREEVVNLQTAQTYSYLKNSLGTEFENHSKVMHEILLEAKELDAEKGTNWADQIARNPDSLMALAKEKITFLQAQSNKDIASKKKAESLRVANEIGKGNTVKGNLPNQNFGNLSLDEMNSELKRLGIKK